METVIEDALRPINEDLSRIVYQRNGQSTETDVLRILTLMASIRTHALENGWDQACDRDLDAIQSILNQ